MPTPWTRSLAAAALLAAGAAFPLAFAAEPGPAPAPAPATPSGAKVYAANCLRCHQAPDPAQHDDAAWGSISLHMRLFADLTRGEQQAVRAYLGGGPAKPAGGR